MVKAFHHGAVFAHTVVGIDGVTAFRREVVDGIIAPVIRRTRLRGSDGGLLLLSIGRILREISWEEPGALVFVHAGEMEGRQDVHGPESALGQCTKMLHAV